MRTASRNERLPRFRSAKVPARVVDICLLLFACNGGQHGPEPVVDQREQKDGQGRRAGGAGVRRY